MSVKPIPEGFHSITPYLAVPGVFRLIEFLKRAFDAEESHRITRPDGTIHNVEMTIGDSKIMMGEPPPGAPAMTAALYLYVPDVDATYRRALDAGATSLMEPADMFYGDRNAGVQDPSGNSWWIATHIEDVNHEEMSRRAAAQHAR